ncbi:MAG: hypothetical protein B7C24_10395 [Bacteroidetes bacterium 4572_77]|nr:MAG: hypothetical protein B7C24_10395 [Bacteroidetes bacterium 4572_77]
MKLKKAVAILSMGAFLTVSGIGLTSCTSTLTPEQLAELSTLRKETRSLNKSLETTKTDLGEINRELDAQQSKLDDCNERQQFVKDKLDKWPNIWPDWTPAPPVAPELNEVK